MIKMNTICLRCGNVQIRTNLIENSQDRYVVLKNKCPKCKIETPHIATENDIPTLRKQLEENPSKPLDGYVLKLIKR